MGSSGLPAVFNHAIQDSHTRQILRGVLLASLGSLADSSVTFCSESILQRCIVVYMSPLLYGISSKSPLLFPNHASSTLFLGRWGASYASYSRYPLVLDVDAHMQLVCHLLHHDCHLLLLQEKRSGQYARDGVVTVRP